MRSFFQIVIREFLRLKKRPNAWIMVLFIPTVTFFYLGAIYSRGAIESVPVAIQDNDHSDLSRKLVSYIRAAPKLELVKTLTSNDDPKTIFNKNPHIKGLFVIPEDFSKNIFSGYQEKFIVYTNSANIIYGNLLYKEAATFVNIISAGINLNSFKLKGIPHEKAMKMVMPIKVVAKPLYNPYYNYLYYLVPGLTTVLLQMIVFFLAARSLNSEYRNQTMDTLIRIADGNLFKIIAAKAFTYILLGFTVAVIIFAFVHPMLQIPPGAKTLPFLGVVLLFISANVLLGIMVSAIFKDEAIAMDASFVYNSPAFVFSGFTFPVMAMPAFDKWYAQLIPYTHFLRAFTKMEEMGVALHYVYPQLIALLVFCLVGYMVTAAVLFFQLKKQRV